MDTMLTRVHWEAPTSGAVCLSKGRAGNARVYLVTLPEGKAVVKDFRKSPWWIRWTFGRFMIGHEFALMKRLEGMPGIPQHLRRIDRYAFAMDWMPGETLSAYNDREYARAACIARNPAAAAELCLPESYFAELESLVREMHRRGVTHLDDRNAKNVLILPGKHPGLLDFQAGIRLHAWYPRWFREILCLADISGVYKHWYRALGTLSEDRKETLRRHFRLRRMWVFKGYSFFKKRKPKGLEVYLFGEDGKGGH